MGSVLEGAEVAVDSGVGAVMGRQDLARLLSGVKGCFGAPGFFLRYRVWEGKYVKTFSFLPLEKNNLDGVKLDDSKKKEEEKRWYRSITWSFTNWLQAFAILASVIGENAPENCFALFMAVFRRCLAAFCFCSFDFASHSFHIGPRRRWRVWG